jgi:hypothetical protein
MFFSHLYFGIISPLELPFVFFGLPLESPSVLGFICPPYCSLFQDRELPGRGRVRKFLLPCLVCPVIIDNIVSKFDQ